MSRSSTGVVQKPESLQAVRAAGEHGAIVWLFTVAVFWGSSLLFLLEPMFTKMILPKFGGSPAVWNTAMVFFQAELFLAYIYSHSIANRSIKVSVPVHSLAVLSPLAILPIDIRAASNLELVVKRPEVAVLWIAIASIGLPFFLVATNAPLLQGWFSRTGHRDAPDPYFLYAASNAGSLIGLALYPCFFEPQFGIRQQAMLWSFGYGIFAALTLICGFVVYRSHVPGPQLPAADVKVVRPLTDRLLWAALAFVPASLLYAFTAQLSMDFPPIPLLWVIPLGLYLATFVIAFSSNSALSRRCGRLLPAVVVASMVIFLLGFGVRPGGWAAMGVIKLFCFTVIALAFHAGVADRRPGHEQLTEYFLWVSAGGILGGLLNAFVAPLMFSDYWEYPLTLLAAAALLPAISNLRRRSIHPRFLGIAIGVTGIVGMGMRLAGSAVGTGPKLMVLAIGAILCMRVPPKWAAAAIAVIALSIGRIESRPLYQGRSFFGVYQVTTAAGGKWHLLRHGTTIHGLQRIVDSPQTTTPRGYYIPVKNVFKALLSKDSAPHVAVVGLGAGIISCYSTPEQTTTFFEIDPLVEKIAERYFTLLSQCPGHSKVILGDARLTMREAAQHSFDVIVLDAFSSDSIPIHLLTREAFGLYSDKLASDGILLVHISNNYLQLAPVIAGSCPEPGYSVVVLEDLQITPSEATQGRMPSRWAAVVPNGRVSELEGIGWRPFTGSPITWTDDHSSVFSVMQWSKLFGIDLVKPTALRTSK